MGPGHVGAGAHVLDAVPVGAAMGEPVMRLDGAPGCVPAGSEASVEVLVPVVPVVAVGVLVPLVPVEVLVCGA